jgi:hypothetical protein
VTGRRGRGHGSHGAALAAFANGALFSVVAGAVLKAHPPGGAERWTRRSHAGRPVTLLEGPAYAVGAVAGALAGCGGGPAAVAVVGASAFGALDDLSGDSTSKGLRGHLAAAARGEVTTGTIKIVGLVATGALSALMIDRSADRQGTGRHALMATAVGGSVIAGSANMANLLDLRPGRTLKVVLLLVAPFLGGSPCSMAAVAAGAAAGAAVGTLPDDLAGRTMLGDTGANSAGALLGTALVARTGLRGRLLALSILTALTLASERVSFTRVIESTPGLRELDALGRPRSPQPPGAPGR